MMKYSLRVGCFESIDPGRKVRRGGGAYYKGSKLWDSLPENDFVVFGDSLVVLRRHIKNLCCISMYNCVKSSIKV